VREERVGVFVVQRAQQLGVVVADGGLPRMDGEPGGAFARAYVR
jgi:hypothetical protein